MNAEQRQKLLFRRQFFCGENFGDFPDWQHVTLPNGRALSVHPDLQVTVVKTNGYQLILLGYILDPGEPQAENEQILKRLCVNSNEVIDIIGSLDDLGGRYVLFIFSPGLDLVLNDAGGLRQVFHHKDTQSQIWLASQPGLFENKFGFTYPDEVHSFLNSETILKYREPWWPGESSPFSEVKHLLPNHYLDLRIGSIQRYWPRNPIVRYSLEEGAEKSASILRGLMKAANHRFKLAMALTGGYDSRIVFAASKSLVQDLHVYSMIYHRLTPDSPDITLAAELAGYAGVPHHIFACDQSMDEDFNFLYTHNLEKSYQSYGNIVYGRFLNLDQKYVVVKSVVNEIARCFYYRDGVYPYKVTADFLCKVSKLGEHPFVHRNFSAWLEDAQLLARLGYKVLDFFYWENRNANWQAMSQLEFDLAHEEWTPFAHRNLLATMLGVDYKHRHMPKNVFQRELVRQSWPELDLFSFNPRGKVIKKPFYEGPWMTLGRWAKYHIFKRK